MKLSQLPMKLDPRGD